MIVEKVSETKSIYITGTTLHVHILHIRKKDELNFISLATHLHLVSEVRIHSFQVDFYLTARRFHTRIVPSRWEAVKFVLPYINRGQWVENEGKREREIKITFDDFLQPAVQAWRAGKPFADLLFEIPEYDIELISEYTILPEVHRGIGALVAGYSSESNMEVEIVHDNLRNSHEDDDEIMMVLGFPFFPVGHP